MQNGKKEKKTLNNNNVNQLGWANGCTNQTKAKTRDRGSTSNLRITFGFVFGSQISFEKNNPFKQVCLSVNSVIWMTVKNVYMTEN